MAGIEDELFALVTRAYPYRNLSRETFESVLEMLSEGIAARRGRYGAYIHRDRVNRKLRARRGAAWRPSPAAAPFLKLRCSPWLPNRKASSSARSTKTSPSRAMRGDIMLLGNTSWRIRRVEGKSGRVLVEDAHGAPPSVPFWRGEAPARTEEFSDHVGDLRQQISDDAAATSPPVGDLAEPCRKSRKPSLWLKQECGLDDSGAEQMIEYILQGRAVLGAVPTQTPSSRNASSTKAAACSWSSTRRFGGRINKAWGLALRKRFCRSFNFELQAAATDNGLNIALAEQHSFPLADVFHFLQAETRAAGPGTGCAWLLRSSARAGAGMRTARLALLRFQDGKKVPPQIQRMRSDDLLASSFPMSPPARKTSKATSRFPTILW